MSASRYLITIFITVASIAPAQERVFTNKEGNQITARIDSVAPDWITMTLIKNGRPVTYQPALLSLDDQQFVKDWLQSRGIKSPQTENSNPPALEPTPPPVAQNDEEDFDGADSFSLSKGDEERLGASLTGKRILFRAEVIPAPENPDGTIFAIGGRNCGLAVYVMDNEIHAIKRGDGPSKQVSVPLPDGAFQIKVKLNSSGLSLATGDDTETRDDAVIFTRTPSEGTCLGFDSATNVGRYPDDFNFPGEINAAMFLIK